MAHDRKRHAQALYQNLLSFKPIVGVFGHRQVGKSTFIAQNVEDYRTLDDEGQLKEAVKNAKQYIQNRKSSVAIDECQLVPKLFPALKEYVRTHKKPGQFILSGSVRFTSRKAIRESLAGRMAFFEMLPFSVAEIRSEPLPDVIPKLLTSKVFSNHSLEQLRPKNQLNSLKKDFEIYLKNGGLPGLCFIREKQHRVESLSFLHDLMIDRDLRLVLDTKLSTATIRKFIRMIAMNSWNQYNAAEIKRTLGLASQTQKNLLYALESIFLIRRIPFQGKKGETLLLEDQFEELILSEEKIPILQQLTSALFRNIRSQLTYRLGFQAQFETYETRDGARVPLVIHTAESTLGIIVTQSATPTVSEKRSANSFLSKTVNSKVIFASQDIIEPVVISERLLSLPLYSIL
jgi:predicted AAA+ superfamily ATPase